MVQKSSHLANTRSSRPLCIETVKQSSHPQNSYRVHCKRLAGLIASAASEGQARVVALATPLWPVSKLLLGSIEQTPDQAEDDDDSPPLGAADTQDLSCALTAEAVVHLNQNRLSCCPG